MATAIEYGLVSALVGVATITVLQTTGMIPFNEAMPAVPQAVEFIVVVEDKQGSLQEYVDLYGTFEDCAAARARFNTGNTLANLAYSAVGEVKATGCFGS